MITDVVGNQSATCKTSDMSSGIPDLDHKSAIYSILQAQNQQTDGSLLVIRIPDTDAMLFDPQSDSIWLNLTSCGIWSNWYVHGLSTFWEYDNMGRPDKQNLMNMTEELLVDMKVKQRQIHVIREEHNHLLSYDVGLVIGKIREMYKRMMTIYRMADDRINGKYKLHPPGIEYYESFHYLLDMEKLHGVEVSIDKHIHVLETIPTETLMDKSASGIVGPGAHHGPGPSSSSEDTKLRLRNRLRTSDNTKNTGFAPEPSNQKEDDIKQRYRDQYKTRSGHNGNWTLDEYYGIV